MRINTTCKPQLAAATEKEEEERRPGRDHTLALVKVDRFGTAWATNGHIAAKVPNYLDPFDDETLDRDRYFQASHLADLAKRVNCNNLVILDGTAMSLVAPKNGGVATILETDTTNSPYPSFDDVWVQPIKPGEERFCVHFNPELLLTLAKALGWNPKDPNTGVRLEIPMAKINGPWRVTVSNQAEGVLMPIRGDGEVGLVRKEDEIAGKRINADGTYAD